RRSWIWCGTSTGSGRRRRSMCTCRGCGRSSRTTPRRPCSSPRAGGSGSGSRRPGTSGPDRRLGRVSGGGGVALGFEPGRRGGGPGRGSGAMRVRGRLMLAFGYLLLVVIVALEVPLAVNLRNRSLAEQRAQETTLAVATAAQAKSLLTKGERSALQHQVRAQA